MNFVAIDFRRQFGRGNEFDAGALACQSHARTPLDRIMVSQSYGFEALFHSQARDFLRGKGAIREARVQMKVSAHFNPLAGRISSPLILSRIPFTNLPLSWVENFLAISTASLMLTTGGMSSRWSIS